MNIVQFPNTTSPLDLTLRKGLPQELLFLAHEFPRERWHTLGSYTTAHNWLGMHDRLRRLQQHMWVLSVQWQEHGLAPMEFHRQILMTLHRYMEDMSVHHHVESQAYFPQLQRIEPRLVRGFELMESDHATIDGALHEMVESFQKLQAAVVESDDWSRAAERLINVTSQSTQQVGRHLFDEEDLVIPLLALQSERYGNG